MKERLELIAGSRPLTDDNTMIESGQMMIKMLVRQIRDINLAIEDYDKRIEKAFKEHPDAFIFQSFPGAGKQQAPRLLAAFGDDRGRYKSANMQKTLNQREKNHSSEPGVSCEKFLLHSLT